jgi:hypothetical protein
MAVWMEVVLSMLIQRRVRKAVCRVITLTGCVVFGVTGVAFASCPAPDVSTPFSQWGDTNSYFLLPGGTFEGTADDVGWTLDNASLTPGNEPFNITSPSDSQSLTIDGGGSATSPFFCVDNTMSAMRFFAQQTVPGSELKIDALIQRSWGIKTISIAALTDGSITSWAPTDPITGGASSIPANQTLMVALRFTVPSPGSSWQIDDVYIDPWRSG